MNGGDLPVAHGAPVRLRLERQIGYKSMKYVRRLVVADEFDDGGVSGSIQNGWAWYNGIADCLPPSRPRSPRRSWAAGTDALGTPIP